MPGAWRLVARGAAHEYPFLVLVVPPVVPRLPPSADRPFAAAARLLRLVPCRGVFWVFIQAGSERVVPKRSLLFFWGGCRPFFPPMWRDPPRLPQRWKHIIFHVWLANLAMLGRGGGGWWLMPLGVIRFFFRPSPDNRVFVKAPRPLSPWALFPGGRKAEEGATFSCYGNRPPPPRGVEAGGFFPSSSLPTPPF